MNFSLIVGLEPIRWRIKVRVWGLKRPRWFIVRISAATSAGSQGNAGDQRGAAQEAAPAVNIHGEGAAGTGWRFLSCCHQAVTVSVRTNPSQLRHVRRHICMSAAAAHPDYASCLTQQISQPASGSQKGR